MRKFILAALLALPLVALHTERAAAWGCGCGDGCSMCCGTPTITANIGIKFKLFGGLSCCCDNCCGGCGGCGGGCCGGGGMAAPWYSYWPYDAHFMTPAPTGYPNWPAGMGAMMYGSPCASAYGPPPPPMALPGPSPYAAPATVQPCGYTPAQAPSYWYGR
jgi:hypothetical protein